MFTLFAVLVLVACESRPVVEPADLVLLNGGIYTVDEDRRWVEAAAIRDGRFIVVGNQADVEPLIGPRTRTIDLTGRMALPGFHDAHVHPLSGGQALLGCNLAGQASVSAILEQARQCAGGPGSGWLQGYDFDLGLFGQDGPHRSALDAIDDTRPIVLWSSDGHNAWVNSAALALAGIDADTPDPDLGVIERDPDGFPSGTLRETAQELIRNVIPAPTIEQDRAALAAGIAHLNRHGITSFIDAWVDENDLLAYDSLDDAGELTARIRTSMAFGGGLAQNQGEEFERMLAERLHRDSGRVDHGAIKLFLDGVLEGETAALLDNYVGFQHRGELILPPEELNAAVTRFDALGLQVHMHAIGDRAVRAGLDAVEAARRTNGDGDNRHHISHLQLISVDDIERFGTLGVSANFQAAWAYPDRWIMELNLPVVGEERVQSMYPIASVARAGGRLVGGSDWAVSSADPLYAIETAVRRQDAEQYEAPTLNENERVSLATMIEAYTINGAWLMHQEDRTGSIAVGKQADIAILDRNLFEIPKTGIDQARVVETLLDGETVYQARPDTE